MFAPLMGRALKEGLLGTCSPYDPAVYSIVLVLLIVTWMLASWTSGAPRVAPPPRHLAAFCLRIGRAS